MNVVVPPGRTDAVVGFYTGVLGLRRVPKPADGPAATGAWFDVDGTTQVHVSERDGARHPQTHFALVVDDFDAVLRRIADAGAAWDEQPPVFGGRRGFTFDPEGNRVEILEPAGELR